MIKILTQYFFILTSLSLQFFFQACVAAANKSCTPSSCGVLTDISFPFRLKDDPLHCGHGIFELVCENEVAFLHLNSQQKYYVKDINYLNYTIRLVDASINSNDICSFPIYSFSSDFLSDYGYIFDRATVINVISCPSPLKDTSLLLHFTDITHLCPPSNSTRYHYVKVGDMFAPDLPHMCELDLVAMTSWPGFDKDYMKNVSLSQIHQSLLYGFDLRFYSSSGVSQLARTWFKYRDVFVNRLNSPLLIIPVILVMLCAAVGPPVMALIEFTAVVGSPMFHWPSIVLPYRGGSV